MDRTVVFLGIVALATLVLFALFFTPTDGNKKALLALAFAAGCGSAAFTLWQVRRRI